MNDIRFYDTSSLLIAGERLFEAGKHFVISSITLQELEHIKSSANKDPEIKYSARLLLQLLQQHTDLYTVHIHNLDDEKIIRERNLEIYNDTKIALKDKNIQTSFERKPKVI